MANNEAIGILFGVEGEGNISGKSGENIRKQIGDIVTALNSDDVTKIKFSIDINHFKGQIEEIKTQLKEINNAGTGSKKSGGGMSKEYTKRLADVKKYYTELAKVERISKKNTDVVKRDGIWYSDDDAYKAEINKINEYRTEFEKLKLVIRDENDKDVFNPLTSEDEIKRLGLSIEEYEALVKQAKSAEQDFQIKNSQNAQAIQKSWDNNAQKASDYIKRLKDVGADKNDEGVSKLMGEVEELAKSGDPKNLDKLTQKTSELGNMVHKTGADIEKWGHEMSRTFGSHIRSALASLITVKVSQYLKEIYDNVVALDKAVVNLQIASGKSREEAKELVKSYSKLAKELGATTIEVANSADTWLRQGYSEKESETLIKNSMMLSKLGQMESEEAAKALTSAMKGYKISVEDSISIIDKFTAVDMEAAVSAGDIATAMAETAAGADIAGVSMERLTGYITTVAEVTQDGAESVGTFYRTLFARMNNVAAGNFVDDETGESLNDVEKVLGELGIALRDTNGLFRNSSDILDEVGQRWESFDNVQQHAIATAMAGTRQQEKFIVLMENYGSALEYAETATGSAGTATEKYQAYTDGLEASMNSLKSSFESLSMAVLDSDWLAAGIDMLSGLITGLSNIMSFGDGIVVKIGLVIGATALLYTGLSALESKFKKTTLATLGFNTALTSVETKGVVGLITSIPKLIVGLISLISQFGFAKVAALGFKGVLDLLKIDPTMLAISALIAGISLAVAGLNKLANLSEDASKAAKEHADEMREAAEAAKDEMDSLDGLIEKYKEIASKDGVNANNRREIRDIQKQINLLVKGEAAELDLVNDSLDVSLQKLAMVRAEKAKENREAYANSYAAASNYSKEAYQKDHSKQSWWWWWPSNWGQNVARDMFDERDIALADYDKEAAKILNGSWFDGTTGVEGITVDSINDGFLGFSRGMDIDIHGAETAAEYLDIIERAQKALEDDQNYDHYNSDTWTALEGLRKFYQGVVSQEKDAINAYVDSAIEDEVYSSIAGGAVVDSVESFEKFKNDIITKLRDDENISNARKEGAITAEEVSQAVEDYISSIFPQEVVDNFTPRAKAITDIFEETEKEYNALSAAMDDMDSRGALQSDTISNLLEVLPELEDELIATANGYTLSTDALDKHIEKEKQVYVAALAATEKGSEAYKVAYENLKNFLAVIATFELEKTIEEQTKALEEQKEVWEEQLDTQKELVDLRKELLETYAEEQDYQKELEKRQKNVAKLQAQLAVARLDNSAAGQARVRELESELEEAQEDLDDFTLEHAIDVITRQLDDEYEQYERLVNENVAHIEEAIRDVAAEVKNSALSTDEVISALEENEREKNERKNEEKSDAVKAIQDYIDSHGFRESDRNRWMQDPAFAALVKNAQTLGADLSYIRGLDSPQTLANRAVKNVQDYITTHGFKEADRSRWMQDPAFAALVNEAHAAGGDLSSLRGVDSRPTKDMKVSGWTDYNLFGIGGGTYTSSQYESRVVEGQDGAVYLKPFGIHPGEENGGYLKLGEGYTYKIDDNGNYIVDAFWGKPTYHYHTGGFVGGVPDLKNNEEFAKLLKGEFVSTPAQMKRFMEETLPALVGFSPSGGNNEFNAPLVSIHCESVTQESLPELRDIVNSAVKEIQTQLDEGMARVGRKSKLKNFII